LRRKPSVAGYFYPNKKRELQEMIEKMVNPGAERVKAICVISPHAGFIYSGSVAGEVFSSVLLPEKFILLGPNHRTMHSLFGIMREGIWETPLGDVPVDSELADLLLENSDSIEEDKSAHLHEHSLEVQLPFIQYFKKNFSIVPVCVSVEATYQELEELGKAIHISIKMTEEQVMIIASTDMSHYVSQEVAQKYDNMAIEKILKLDSRGLYDVVYKENISMCGFKPTTAALIASKELGAKKATLIKYQTSGEVSGNFSEVVGYVGIRIE